MGEDIERGELLDAVDRAVAELLEAAGIDGPPIDAVALARIHLKIPERKRKGPAPVVEDIQQWQAAQEIGEHLKPSLLRQLGIDTAGGRPLLGASLGNLAAVRVLAPTTWLGDAARGCGFDLLTLKILFSTAGHELIAWHLLDLPEPAMVTVADNGSVSKRKSNAYPVPRELTEAERRCLEYVHENSRPHRVRHEEWTVQGWPIHRVDWKREILRAVRDE